MADNRLQGLVAVISALVGIGGLYVAYQQLEIARHPTVTLPKQDIQPPEADTGNLTSAPPKSVLPTTLTSVNEELRLQHDAIRFVDDFFQRASVETAQDMEQFVNDSYAQKVIYFHNNSEARNEIITDKRRYLGKWPIRSYTLLPGIRAQCDLALHTCLVVGETAFRTQNPLKISCGTSSFRIGLDMQGRSPIVTREQGDALPSSSC